MSRAPGGAASAPRRILLVEDSPSQAAVLAADLEAAGFDVTCAEDGETALELVASNTFDLVLTDLVMPGIDGHEVCRRVKALDRDVPVILLTSLDDPVEIVHGLEAGADNYLRKPYQADQLVSRIETVLHHREMRAGGRAAVGLEVLLRDQPFLITAERQQILDLLMASFEDLVDTVKALRERERSLKESEDRLRSQLDATERERRRIEAVFEAAPNPMVITDADGVITDASDSLCQLLGTTRQHLIGRDVREAACFEDAAGQPRPAVWNTPETEQLPSSEFTVGAGFDLFLQRADGAPVPVLAKAAPVHGPGGEPIAIVGALQDIGTLAAHDSVTRLPNHTIFIDHVSRAAVAALARGGWMGVQAIVVDRFATMCATLPQSAIAQVLEQLAERLRSEVHDDGESTLAYFGNGIFAVLYEELADDLDGVLRSRGLADRLTAERVVIAGEELELSVTSGVSVSDGSEDAVRLVASATAAAHRRPSAGSSRVVVADPDVDARAGDWLRRRSELRDAIDRGEIVPFFQPEVDLRTGRAWGVEALVRWQHPERGLLHPGEFLPLAHETGLIVPLGWAVLESACQLAATWRSEGVPRADELRLSVNVDTLQLEDPEFTDRVRETLSKAGLEPSSLVIEITEHGMLEDAMVAAEQLRSLRSLGVAIAMDDFGTGYSSLVQLRRLPVDFLKIDQSFVAGLSEGGEDTAIVRASVRLARSLGLGTVAEGVETAEQLAMLRQLKCDMAQGYHFARPMPADELAAWWEARGRGEPALPPASPPVVRNHC